MIRIENLKKEHFGTLSEMALEFWPDCDINAETEFWKEVLLSSDHYFALAKDEDGYIGFINISIRADYVEGTDADGTPYLEAIYVRPEFRQKGMASLLLGEGELWVKKQGYTQIASDTELSNHLGQIFHKNSGFQEVSRIVCYIKNI